MGIISASPLSMGLLTQRGPPTWHPAPPEVQEACGKAAAYAGSQGVDISKVALQYSVRWGGGKLVLRLLLLVEGVQCSYSWVLVPQVQCRLDALRHQLVRSW